MSKRTDYAGLAALSICEALLLALHDQGLLPEHEINGILLDAAATHDNAVGTNVETHRAVADLIRTVMRAETRIITRHSLPTSEG